ncbi:MAG TPA: hemolysin family protein [Polyangiaceae bacterium]|nr:hemolysin family protein [Polyangiaceae bacterium]
MIVTELLIILALVAANAVFSGAEIAIVALRKARIEELAGKGRAGARAALRLREQPETFLATVQVGITVVGATAAAFGGSSLAKRIEPFLAGHEWLAEHAEALALGIVISGVSFLSIVVGELVPKSLALRGAERYALLVSQPLLWLSIAAKPLVWLLSSSANLLLKPFSDQTTFTEARHSPSEIQQIVEDAVQAGTVHPEAAEIASRALELPELVVAEVMVPRQSVVAISQDIDRAELRRTLLEQPHSRLPVYDGQIDNVIGYLSVKDVLALAWEERLLVLRDVIREPFFAPSSKKAVELLKEMRNRRQQLAIIVDEHGGMAGIVTMEDLLEELVGEIFDEHDRPLDTIRPAGPDSALVAGTAHLREVSRALDIELPDDGSWTTIAGLVLGLAGRLPQAGESFEAPGGIWLDVVDATPRRIRTVRVRKPVQAQPPGE